MAWNPTGEGAARALAEEIRRDAARLRPAPDRWWVGMPKADMDRAVEGMKADVMRAMLAAGPVARTTFYNGDAPPSPEPLTHEQWKAREEAGRQIESIERRQKVVDRLIDGMEQAQADRRADEARVRANIARAALWSPPLDTSMPAEPAPTVTQVASYPPCTCGAIMNPPHGHPSKCREPRGPLSLRISLWWLRVRLWGMRARLATRRRDVLYVALFGFGAGHALPGILVTLAGGVWHWGHPVTWLTSLMLAGSFWIQITYRDRRTLKEMP